MAEEASVGLEGKVQKFLLVKGIVQGVGFRPFVYRIASEEGIGGYVRNTSKGVEIAVISSESVFRKFIYRLQNELPPLAVIESIAESELTDSHLQQAGIRDLDGFHILTSHTQVKGKVQIPADIAICDECKREIFDRANRHYMYPLTNCTNCGPRFTVIRDVPYDRKMTTMEPFPMCGECAKEYRDPLDRRFHAQPTACPVCGPSLQLLDRDGKVLVIGENSDTFQQVLEQAISQLKQGYILAVKGLGGFHFVCDAENQQAVNQLRERKKRPHKPLAVMARDLQVIRQRCRMTEEEEQALESVRAPIVILDKLDRSDFDSIAPDHPTIGVMLPYTPLHQLLFADKRLDWLVMTSANRSNIPMAITNDQAVCDLQEFVDGFLVHEREIEQRCDDSLVRMLDGQQVIYRRSRGYTPDKIKLPLTTEQTILAVGGEMKNAFAYMNGNEVVLSQHIGEIDSWEGRESFLHAIGHFERLFNWEPTVVVCDKHPSYQVSEIARLLDCANKVEVQHHHAHMASCMGENQLTGRTLGIILDGTGYGDDQTLWGFEFLVGDYREYRRVAYGLPLPVAGGERSIREPWRMAVAVLQMLDAEQGTMLAKTFWPQREQEIDLIRQMIDQRIQVINSSGAGRLFDAVSALLGLCEVSSYEGEAAIRLANCHVNHVSFSTQTTDSSQPQAYPFEIVGNHNGTSMIDWRPMLRAIVDDRIAGLSVEKIASQFHHTILHSILSQTNLLIEQDREIRQVVLSGGTWQNEWLLKAAKQGLEASAIEVYTHQIVPTNDGGIALGQALVAAAHAK